MATTEDIWTRSVRDEASGCLRWTGAHTPKGYGQIRLDGKAKAVHRVAYEATRGPIPDGFEVDHVFERGCRHRDCVEPGHLEAVTHAENVARSLRRITHCPRGHEYTSANTISGKNGRGYPSRKCRACRSARRIERRNGRG